MGVVTNDSCGYMVTTLWALLWLSPHLDTLGLPSVNFHHFPLLVHTLKRVDNPLQGPAVPVEVP